MSKPSKKQRTPKGEGIPVPKRKDVFRDPGKAAKPKGRKSTGRRPKK